MRTIKIGRMEPGYGPAISAKKFNEKKAKALEEVYHKNIPKWYTWLALRLPIFGKAVTVKVRYVSQNKETVEIYFFGRFREEITFIYF